MNVAAAHNTLKNLAKGLDAIARNPGKDYREVSRQLVESERELVRTWNAIEDFGETVTGESRRDVEYLGELTDAQNAAEAAHTRAVLASFRMER